jgi:hypothetical protein
MKSRSKKGVFLVPLVLDRRWDEARIADWEIFLKSLARYQGPGG